MNDQELRTLLIQELGIEHITAEAQDEIIGKIGDIILKSLTATIFETLTPEARAEFDTISALGDPALVRKFLEEHAPNMQQLLEAEMRKTIAGFKTAGK